jgi:hypothetical protein
MRMKLSYFDQSHSVVYVREVEKTHSQLFRCFVFTGTDFLSLPMVWEGKNIKKLSMPLELSSAQMYKFVLGDSDQFVIAASCRSGYAQDFPDVGRIEVKTWSGEV